MKYTTNHVKAAAISVFMLPMEPTENYLLTLQFFSALSSTTLLFCFPSHQDRFQQQAIKKVLITPLCATCPEPSSRQSKLATRW